MKLHLLSKGTNNTKMKKGKLENYRVFSLNLKPHDQNNHGKSVCPFATDACIAACVGDNGHFSMRNGSAHKAQIRKTDLFFSDRQMFYVQLLNDMILIRRQSKRLSYTPIYRLNAYSDIRHDLESIRHIGINLYTWFDDALFYDYTKYTTLANRYDNYKLTYSWNEQSESKGVDVHEMVQRHNIAVVFEEIPETWKGHKVINGDEDDKRIFDPANVIVGLKFKGSKKKLLSAIASGFCIPKVDDECMYRSDIEQIESMNNAIAYSNHIGNFMDELFNL